MTAPIGLRPPPTLDTVPLRWGLAAVYHRDPDAPARRKARAERTTQVRPQKVVPGCACSDCSPSREQADYGA